MQPQTSQRKQVIIVGGGFAGILAALGLRDIPVDVTLTDRRNHHTLQPLLYQVALAVLSPTDMAQPIRSILRGQRSADVLMDEAVGFDLDSRRMKLRSGFRYFDKGDMATIGRHRAIARTAWPFKANWSVYPAFIMWCLVQIFFVMGFHNKMAVACSGFALMQVSITAPG